MLHNDAADWQFRSGLEPGFCPDLPHRKAPIASKYKKICLGSKKRNSPRAPSHREGCGKRTGGEDLSFRRGVFVAFSLLSLMLNTACQLTERPENREGLANDSRSYSYVSYQKDYITRAALQTPGVKEAEVYYTGRRLIVKITPNPDVPPDRYDAIRREARRRISASAPRNPVHIVIDRKR